MRASWSLIAVLGLVPVVAMAGDNAYPTHEHMAPGATSPASHGNGNGKGHGEPDHREFHRFRGSPYEIIPTYTTNAPSDDQSPDPDPPAYVRTEYVPVPYPVPVAPQAPPAPRRPPPIVRYATTGQHIDIPKGAHVTTGSIYKYTQGGVNVYTNVPPPDSTRAKLLFGYTEAVAPAPPPEL